MHYSLLLLHAMDAIIKEAVAKNISRYSLNGLTLPGMVASVYDGDTCDVVLLLPGEGVKRYVIRLLSYNSPEIRVSRLLKYEEREECHKAAVTAKEMLAELLGMNLPVDQRPILRIDCEGWDKYGRLLARIFDKETCINDVMLLNGYGKSM